jgi:hypothetical protein
VLKEVFKVNDHPITVVIGGVMKELVSDPSLVSWYNDKSALAIELHE